MMKKINEKMKNRKGFTLVELVVVIAILGILAAIAVPRFSTVTDNAKDKAVASNQRVIASAVQMYMVDHDTALPSTDADLTNYLNDTIANMQGDPVGSTYTLTYATDKVTIEAVSPTGNTIDPVVIQ